MKSLDSISVLSLTPGFSRVMENLARAKPFQRFCVVVAKTVETVFCRAVDGNTRLKPGVNEIVFGNLMVTAFIDEDLHG
jgi:hypothetical protein